MGKCGLASTTAVTAPLVAPFAGVFPNALGAHGNYLDTAAMLAMIVYALAAWGLRALVRIFARSHHRPAVIIS